jgi:hypothetical protein
MQEHPSRAVKFVWAGSDGQSRGSFAMAHNPKSASTTFIPGNITSLFYDLPGAAGGFSDGNQTAVGLVLDNDATKFWFEVTENGRKTLFDQNGAGFQLGGTVVLLAEGSCLLKIINDDANGFSETLSLFVQIGVSRLVSATFLTPGDSLFRYHEFQVTEGVNPSSVSVELVRLFPGNSTVVPAVFNQIASANNPHIDVWSVNITDQNTLEWIESCVPVLRLHVVVAADANVCSGSKSLPRSAVIRRPRMGRL